MDNKQVARSVLSGVGAFTMVSPWIADMGRTHMQNPHWRPHAKQHDAQTIVMGTFLGAASLYFAWRRAGDWETNLAASSTLGAAFWIGQAASTLFPGTAPADPEFGHDGKVAGVPGQVLVDALIVPLVASAYAIGRKAEPSRDARAGVSPV